jgi:molybdopterin-guanine dinucleotide biosynthesis protein A
MTDRSRVSAIVLAGGRASRFGGSKLSLQLDGRSLVDRAIAAVATLADDIVLAGPGLDGLVGPAGASIRNVIDAEPFAGPLVALAGALREARGDLALVVGGDMPSLVPAVLAAMLGRLEADPAVDAVILAPPAPAAGEPARRQVLPLAVRVESGTPIAARAIEDGDRSLFRLLDRLRFVELPTADWLGLDPAGLTLLDVDRPADLERVRGLDFQ